MKRFLVLIGAALTVGLWSTSASAQFDIDHYLCWQAKGSWKLKDSPAFTVTDQFVTNSLVTKGKKMKYLCNPALKNDSDLGNLQNPDDHLCCWTIKPIIGAPSSVIMSDQFTNQPLSLKKAKLFCTPCEKS